MDPISNNQILADRTILIAPSDSCPVDISSELQRHGARVIQCGQIEIVEPESYAGLDEAIENLFGYDWLIFSNVNAVEFFLRRFLSLGKDLSELDTLRVCAIGEATAAKLSDSRVHFDLVSPCFKANDVLATLETFVGGQGCLRGLNFVLPRSTASHENFSNALEAAGARVDVVAAYRAVLREVLDLARLNALLAGGGIDCVIFTSPATVRDLARLLDASDLGRILADVTVACTDLSTSQTAVEFGLGVDITATEPLGSRLTEAIVRNLSG